MEAMTTLIAAGKLSRQWYRSDDPWRQFDIGLTCDVLPTRMRSANFGHDTRWMAFFDVDEFVFPVELESLSEVLGSREHLPVLGVMGIYFGTSGHEEFALRT